MAELASGLVNIRHADNVRLRAFGKFLQTYELPDVLTWEAIEEAPPSGQFVRSCLLQLGNLYAARGLMSDWSSHLNERGLRRVLERTPRVFSNHMSGFQQWLIDGSVNPNLQLAPGNTEPLTVAARTLVESTSLVARLLNFCATDGALSLIDITPGLITKYQQIILWQFECKSCRNRIAFVSAPPTKCANSSCEASDAYLRKRHLTRGTLISHMSILRIFFDWAKLQKLIPENPISSIICGGARTFTLRGENGEMVEVAEAIRRYDDIVVEKLCAEIVSSKADPEEAMIFYLIIFHSLTNSELRNLRIPSLMKADSSSTFPTAEDFEYLYLPLRPLSRGYRSVIRSDQKIIFARKARSFLKPILKRLYDKRARIVKTQIQQHFLVGAENTLNNKSVTRDYIRHRVSAASLRLLGGAVTASDLRRTAADMFAQRSKRRGAILTQMGFSSLSATRFNYLERFPLQPKKIQRRATDTLEGEN